MMRARQLPYSFRTVGLDRSPLPLPLATVEPAQAQILVRVHPAARSRARTRLLLPPHGFVHTAAPSLARPSCWHCPLVDGPGERVRADCLEPLPVASVPTTQGRLSRNGPLV